MKLKIFCCLWAVIFFYVLSASAQENDVFFYSGGEKIFGELSNDIIAVRSKIGQSINEVKVQGTTTINTSLPATEGLSVFEKEGITFLNIIDQQSFKSSAVLSPGCGGDEDVEEVGYPFFLPSTEVPLILTDEFVVKFKPDITRSQIDAFNAANYVELVKKSPHVENKMVLKVTEASWGNAIEVANAYYESALTVFSHPNFIVHTEERFVPDDALYSDQWHLENTGQRGGTADADIDAEDAWDITRGDSSIIIAVIDDGVQIQHEDLQPNQFTNTGETPGNGIDDDTNGYIDDVHGWNFYDDTGDTNRPTTSDGHGTSVAGVAVGRGNNSIGISGVCPNCTLLPVAKGSTANDHAESFYYAESMGAQILTNSWGYTIGTPATDAVVDAINDVATNGRGGLGCVITFAMTNENVENCDPTSPDISAIDNVIAVSRSDDNDVMDNAGFGDCLEILGPTRRETGGRGPGQTTTDQTGSDGYGGGDYVDSFGGTSGATPVVAGVAALMLSVDPTLTKDAVRTILIETAEKIDATAAGYDSVTGFSSTHGYGRVNAFLAVSEAAPNVAPVADANGPYSEDCTGLSSSVVLDGTGSSDPNFGDTVTYYWETNCPGGSFDDDTSSTPTLNVNSSNGCNINCNVSLTVTDDDGLSDVDGSSVTIQDNDAPDIFEPSDITIECDESTSPTNIGTATAIDACDPDPVISWSDSSGPGSCPNEETILRSWTATDNCANADANFQFIQVVDNTPPVVEVTTPAAGVAVQDGVVLTATALDACGATDSLSFTIRENGVPIGYEDLLASQNSSGDWVLSFDTTVLLDGYYTIFAKAVDSCGNEDVSATVSFSIRNWAVLEMLPSTESNKAGRTMPVKFSLRIVEAVDPAQPFVYNEQLEIRIYQTSKPSTILQSSFFGISSKDYRVTIEGEKYITNFKTGKKPMEYTVEIWRPSNNFLIGSFTFETVK